jgi:hypothetical protein
VKRERWLRTNLRTASTPRVWPQTTPSEETAHDQPSSEPEERLERTVQALALAKRKELRHRVLAKFV